jgi:hypothetical protein
MTGTRISFLATLVVLTRVVPVCAQQPDTLAPGVRVRVTVPRPDGQLPDQVTGRLLRLYGDTVVIATPTTVVAALPPGARLEMLAESHDRALMGAIIGLIGGGAVGNRLAPPSKASGSSPVPHTGLEDLPYGAALGAAVGCLLGYSVGRQLRTERWVPVQTTGLRIGMAGRGGRVSLAVAVAF